METGRGTAFRQLDRLVEVLDDAIGAAVVEPPRQDLGSWPRWRLNHGLGGWLPPPVAVNEEEFAAGFEGRGDHPEKRVQPLVRNVRQPEGKADPIISPLRT